MGMSWLFTTWAAFNVACVVATAVDRAWLWFACFLVMLIESTAMATASWHSNR